MTAAILRFTVLGAQYAVALALRARQPQPRLEPGQLVELQPPPVRPSTLEVVLKIRKAPALCQFEEAQREGLCCIRWCS